MSIERIVVLNDASRNTGGAAALALLSVREFRKRGLSVTYICGDDGDSAELRALGVEIIAGQGAALLEKSTKAAAVDGIYDSAMRDHVAAYITEHDTPGTVYHLHAWSQIFSPSIFRALAPVAERSFIHAHDMFLACPNGVYMNYQRGQVCPLRPMSVKCIATNCDKRSYLHKGWRIARQSVLRNCLDTSLNWGGIIQIHPGMQERLERANLPARIIRTVRNPATPYSKSRIHAEDNRPFLYVGRLEHDKGVMLLAEAADRCGADVIFVGDGPLRDELNQRFPQMTLAGWKSGDEIGEIAATARALVMPSAHPEPFSLVLPEAIHSGLPVLVSDTALMAPEIESAGLGFAFSATDPADFDRAIKQMRHMHNDELSAMSLRGHRGKTRLALSPSEWAHALLSLYSEVVSVPEPCAARASA